MTDFPDISRDHRVVMTSSLRGFLFIFILSQKNKICGENHNDNVT